MNNRPRSLASGESQVERAASQTAACPRLVRQIAMLLVGLIPVAAIGMQSASQPESIDAPVANTIGAAAPGPNAASDDTRHLSDPVKQAQALLSQKSADELYRISRNRKLFEAKSEAEKKRLRAMYAQLKTHPNALRLEKVMRQYYGWLMKLDEQQRAEVMDLPPEKRIRRIMEIRRQQEIDWLGKIGPTRLPKQDAVPVYLWFEDALDKKKDYIIEKGIEWAEQGLVEFDPRLISLAKSRSIANMGRDRYERMQRNIASFMLFEIQDKYPQLIPELFTPDDFDTLKPFLSERAQAILEERLPEEQGLLVIRWLADARKIQQDNSIPTERLEWFAETHLSPDARDELDAMTSDARRKRLIELYNKWRETEARRRNGF